MRDDGKVDWNRWNRPKTGWGEKDYDWSDKHTVPEKSGEESLVLLGAGVAFAAAVLTYTYFHSLPEKPAPKESAPVSQPLAKPSAPAQSQP